MGLFKHRTSSYVQICTYLHRMHPRGAGPGWLGMGVSPFVQKPSSSWVQQGRALTQGLQRRQTLSNPDSVQRNEQKSPRQWPQDSWGEWTCRPSPGPPPCSAVVTAFSPRRHSWTRSLNTPHGSQTVDMAKKGEEVWRGRGDPRAEGPAGPPHPGPRAHTPNSDGTEAAQVKVPQEDYTSKPP